MRRKDSFFPLLFKGVGYVIYLVVAITLIIAMGAIGVGTGIVSAIAKSERIYEKADFQKDFDSLFQTSYAYFDNKDDKGKHIPIGAFRNEGNQRKLIKSKDQVTPYLPKAFLAIEDQQFYHHKGVVPRSLLRATYQQLADTEITTGGSTITQQLVKNVILKNSRKNLERKTKEILLAIRLEKMYDKNAILVYYMNSVFFGEGANGNKMYGVEAAAKGLFNKTAKELNLAQAAYIAGMVQRPNDLNPLSEDRDNLKRGLNRMKLVLKRMRIQNKITEKEYQEALRFDIQKSLAKPSQFSYGYKKYPYIMFALETEAAEALMEKDHLNIEQLSKEGKYLKTLKAYQQKVATGGYHFYTTINQDLYDAINEAAGKNLTFHTHTYKGKKIHEQLGATVIDNKTGAVIAFVPGTSHFSNNQKDHAFSVRRQPGSAIKPLLVYGPALEEGIISPSSQVIDEPLAKSDGSGYYKNAGGNYRGPVNITTALKYSYNIPAIKTFNALGHEKGFDYIRKMGLYPDERDGEAAAIGGLTHGFTVEKMTAAFATFPNGGKYNKPFLISKITDADGKVVWEHKTQPKKIFSEQTAYQMTNMLKQVLSSGTATYINSLIPSGYNVAGKTGTTSDEKDLWFIGYTPEITLGVWSGYDYLYPISNDHFTKRAWANIFKAIAKSDHVISKGSSFYDPGGSKPSVCGFECDKVKSAAKKKEEEQNKKQQDKKEQPPKDREQAARDLKEQLKSLFKFQSIPSSESTTPPPVPDATTQRSEMDQ